MKRILLFMLGAALCCGLFVTAVMGQQNLSRETSARGRRLDREVRAVLDAQVEAWNRGDIEGFMRGYAQWTDTTFISGDTLTRGWQTVLDRYKKNYNTRERMGVLTFSELEIKALGRDTALVLGRWQLKRAGDTAGGRFTLIFRRTRAGLRVIHDHTS